MNPFVAHLVYGLCVINTVLAVAAGALLALELLGGRRPLPSLDQQLQATADTTTLPVLVHDVAGRPVLDEDTPGGVR